MPEISLRLIRNVIEPLWLVRTRVQIFFLKHPQVFQHHSSEDENRLTPITDHTLAHPLLHAEGVVDTAPHGLPV